VRPVVEDKCSIYYLRHSKHSKSISNDERFGEIGVFLLDDSKRKMFSKEFITENYKEAIDKVIPFGQKSSSPNPYMTKFLGFEANQELPTIDPETNETTTTYKYYITSYYELSSEILQGCTNNNICSGKPFTHQDLTFIVYQLLMAESQLNETTD